ncbi:unnamed protein product, partial [Prorocentrum cordatum]
SRRARRCPRRRPRTSRRSPWNRAPRRSWRTIVRWGPGPGGRSACRARRAPTCSR